MPVAPPLLQPTHFLQQQNPVPHQNALEALAAALPPDLRHTIALIVTQYPHLLPAVTQSLSTTPSVEQQIAMIRQIGAALQQQAPSIPPPQPIMYQTTPQAPLYAPPPQYPPPQTYPPPPTNYPPPPPQQQIPSHYGASGRGGFRGFGRGRGRGRW